MRPEGLSKSNDFIHLNGSRTRDLPSCSHYATACSENEIYDLKILCEKAHSIEQGGNGRSYKTSQTLSLKKTSAPRGTTGNASEERTGYLEHRRSVPTSKLSDDATIGNICMSALSDHALCFPSSF
jgi:hypothetical protein